jgi:hypothetical protein
MHGASKYYLNTIPVFNETKFNIFLCVLREKDTLTRYFEEKGIKVLHLGRGKFDPMTLVDIMSITKKSLLSG